MLFTHLFSERFIRHGFYIVASPHGEKRRKVKTVPIFILCQGNGQALRKWLFLFSLTFPSRSRPLFEQSPVPTDTTGIPHYFT